MKVASSNLNGRHVFFGRAGSSKTDASKQRSKRIFADPQNTILARDSMTQVGGLPAADVARREYRIMAQVGFSLPPTGRRESKQLTVPSKSKNA